MCIKHLGQDLTHNQRSVVIYNEKCKEVIRKIYFSHYDIDTYLVESIQP